VLADRALALVDTDIRLACHLVEWAAAAASDSELAEVHAARAQVYATRRTQELSLMSKGIYGQAADQSREISS
jgi:hypothetical protein